MGWTGGKAFALSSKIDYMMSGQVPLSSHQAVQIPEYLQIFPYVLDYINIFFSFFLGVPLYKVSGLLQLTLKKSGSVLCVGFPPFLQVFPSLLRAHEPSSRISMGLLPTLQR